MKVNTASGLRGVGSSYQSHGGPLHHNRKKPPPPPPRWKLRVQKSEGTSKAGRRTQVRGCGRLLCQHAVSSGCFSETTGRVSRGCVTRYAWDVLGKKRCLSCRTAQSSYCHWQDFPDSFEHSGGWAIWECAGVSPCVCVSVTCHGCTCSVSQLPHWETLRWRHSPKAPCSLWIHMAASLLAADFTSTIHAGDIQEAAQVSEIPRSVFLEICRKPPGRR